MKTQDLWNVPNASDPEAHQKLLAIMRTEADRLGLREHEGAIPGDAADVSDAFFYVRPVSPIMFAPAGLEGIFPILKIAPPALPFTIEVLYVSPTGAGKTRYVVYAFHPNEQDGFVHTTEQLTVLNTTTWIDGVAHIVNTMVQTLRALRGTMDIVGQYAERRYGAISALSARVMPIQDALAEARSGIAQTS